MHRPPKSPGMNFARNTIISKGGKAIAANEYMPISVTDCHIEAFGDAIAIGSSLPMDRQIYLDMKTDIEQGMLARDVAEKYARQAAPFGLDIWTLVNRGADLSSILAFAAAIAGVAS